MAKTPRAKKPPSQLPAKRRTRRKPEELYERLVEAAVEEFAQNGYAGARTATIAQRAGVVEPLLFKYFGSKANLFQRAIFENLDRHYNRFVEEHVFDPDDPSKWHKQAAEYVAEQQNFLRKNSRMFMSLILHESFDAHGVEGIDGLGGLQEFLDKMSSFAEEHRAESAAGDPNLVARISFGSLLACVLFADWLFPKGRASEEQIRSAVIDFILKGADIPSQRERTPG